MPPRTSLNSASCVTDTTAVPPSRSSERKEASSAQVLASWPKVGSSRTSTWGWAARTVATDRRRFSPPESVYGLASTSSVSRSRSSSSSTRSSPRPRCRGPNISSSSTRPVTNWCSGSWNTVPILAISCWAFHRYGSIPAPALRSRVADTLPETGASRPARVRAKVDFPEPLGPVMVSASPARTWAVMPDCTGSGGTGRKPPRSPARRGRSRETARSSAASSSCPAGLPAASGPAARVPRARVCGT